MSSLQPLYVFDGYGTLFDVHAAVRHNSAALGEHGIKLSEIWRQKQLEYSWVRSLCQNYKDFWSLTEDALDTAFALVHEADKNYKANLLQAYSRLDCFSEVPLVMRNLKERGARLALLCFQMALKKCFKAP